MCSFNNVVNFFKSCILVYLIESQVNIGLLICVILDEEQQQDKRRWEAADQNHDNFLDKEEFGNFLHPEDVSHMRHIYVKVCSNLCVPIKTLSH